MAKREEFHLYPNGAQVRWHNKRIVVTEKEDATLLTFHNLDEEPDTPAVYHECIKGKVRFSAIKMSNDAAERLLFALLEWRKHKRTINTPNETKDNG